jgi:hypothetical protein
MSDSVMSHIGVLERYYQRFESGIKPITVDDVIATSTTKPKRYTKCLTTRIRPGKGTTSSPADPPAGTTPNDVPE